MKWRFSPSSTQNRVPRWRYLNIVLPFLLLSLLLFAWMAVAYGQQRLQAQQTAPPVLQIIDRNTQTSLADYPLPPSGEFSVSFRHSVNQSMVEDFYRVEQGEFLVYQTLYYHFGAGVQTQLEQGQTLTKLPDGGMLLQGLDQVITPLLYNISPVYDHILNIGQDSHSLGALGTRGVAFQLRES